MQASPSLFEAFGHTRDLFALPSCVLRGEQHEFTQRLFNNWPVMVGRPSKKPKFSSYVDMNEARPVPAYDRFRSYGIQHNGDMSVDTTYMLSQSSTDEVPIPSSPILPSDDDWNEPEYQDPEPQGLESEPLPKKKRTAAVCFLILRLIKRSLQYFEG
jgi:hypothetical protein